MATDGAGMAHTTAVVPSPHTPSNKLIGFARFTQVVLVLAGGSGPLAPPPLSYAPADVNKKLLSILRRAAAKLIEIKKSLSKMQNYLYHIPSYLLKKNTTIYTKPAKKNNQV
jgi:hypothetical protein